MLRSSALENKKRGTKAVFGKEAFTVSVKTFVLLNIAFFIVALISTLLRGGGPSSLLYILYIYGILFLTIFVISWIKRKD